MALTEGVTPTAAELDEALATPEGEATAAETGALFAILESVNDYRTASEAMGFSPTAAECMAIDRHRLLFANIERAAAMEHENQLARLRLSVAMVNGLSK